MRSVRVPRSECLPPAGPAHCRAGRLGERAGWASGPAGLALVTLNTRLGEGQGQALDSDQSGGLDSNEFRAAIQKLVMTRRERGGRPGARSPSRASPPGRVPRDGAAGPRVAWIGPAGRVRDGVEGPRRGAWSCPASRGRVETVLVVERARPCSRFGAMAWRGACRTEEAQRRWGARAEWSRAAT